MEEKYIVLNGEKINLNHGNQKDRTKKRKVARGRHRSKDIIVIVAILGVVVFCFFLLVMPDLTLSKIEDGFKRIEKYGPGSLTEDDINAINTAHDFSLYLAPGPRKNTDLLIDELVYANEVDIHFNMDSTEFVFSPSLQVFTVILGTAVAAVMAIFKFRHESPN